MTDLVKRLRLAANPDCWWAADEIERLRALVAELETQLDCSVAPEELRQWKARVAELEAKLPDEAAAWESAARIDAAMGKGK